jgi:hypothetical protein
MGHKEEREEWEEWGAAVLEGRIQLAEVAARLGLSI